METAIKILLGFSIIPLCLGIFLALRLLKSVWDFADHIRRQPEKNMNWVGKKVRSSLLYFFPVYS